MHRENYARNPATLSLRSRLWPGTDPALRLIHFNSSAIFLLLIKKNLKTSATFWETFALRVTFQTEHSGGMLRRGFQALLVLLAALRGVQGDLRDSPNPGPGPLSTMRSAQPPVALGQACAITGPVAQSHCRSGQQSPHKHTPPPKRFLEVSCRDCTSWEHRLD